MIKNRLKKLNNRIELRKEISQDFSRNLGRIQHMQNFCIKHDCSLRPVMEDEDPVVIAIEAIGKIMNRNYTKMETEGSKDLYLYMKVFFNDEKIFHGYFTLDEANDISRLDSRLVIK